MAAESPKVTVRAILNDVWLRSFYKNIRDMWIIDEKSVIGFITNVPIRLMESGFFPLMNSPADIAEAALREYVLGKKRFSGRLAYAEKIVIGITVETQGSVMAILREQQMKTKTLKDAEKEALLNRLTEAISALYLIRTDNLLDAIFNALEGIERYSSEQVRLERIKETLARLFP